MIGAIVLIVVMLLAIPGVLMLGGAIAVALGWSLKADAESRHEGSELIDLNQ